MAGRMSKSDKLGAVDHSKIDYPPFRRNFYIEVQELQKMSEEDVAKYRKELEDIKVRPGACIALLPGVLGHLCVCAGCEVPALEHGVTICFLRLPPTRHACCQ